MLTETLKFSIIRSVPGFENSRWEQYCSCHSIRPRSSQSIYSQFVFNPWDLPGFEIQAPGPSASVGSILQFR